MKYLVIGSSGQLGWELQRSLHPFGEVVPVDFPDIDLTNPDSIQDWVRGARFDVIINAAAYTNVDQAEVEVDLARQVNSIAPGILAREASAMKAIFIHFSTDYVFNGETDLPYRESELPDPINVYGESKLAGEKAVQEIGQDYFIFRTSWLYSTRRDCFVTKVLKWSRTKAELKIVTDQIGSPTWARTLADTTAEAIQGMHSKGRSWVRQKSGIYHLAGNGSASRFEWAKKILEFDPRKDEHVLTRIQEAKSQDFKNGAQRPNFSALDCALFQNTFDLFYTDWLMDLKQALTQ